MDDEEFFWNDDYSLISRIAGAIRDVDDSQQLSVNCRRGMTLRGGSLLTGLGLRRSRKHIRPSRFVNVVQDAVEEGGDGEKMLKTSIYSPSTYLKNKEVPCFTLLLPRLACKCVIVSKSDYPQCFGKAFDKSSNVCEIQSIGW